MGISAKESKNLWKTGGFFTPFFAAKRPMVVNPLLFMCIHLHTKIFKQVDRFRWLCYTHADFDTLTRVKGLNALARFNGD